MPFRSIPIYIYIYTRASTRFFLYNKEQKSEVLKNDPTLTRPPDLSKRMAKLWTELPEEQKRIYQQRSAENYASWKTEYDAYLATHNTKATQVEARKQAKVVQNVSTENSEMPKPPCTAFFHRNMLENL